MFRLHPSRQLRMVTCNAWTPFYLLNKVTSITKLKLPNMKNNILQFDQGPFMCKTNDSLNGGCPDILQWTKKRYCAKESFEVEVPYVYVVFHRTQIQAQSKF